MCRPVWKMTVIYEGPPNYLMDDELRTVIEKYGYKETGSGYCLEGDGERDISFEKELP